MSKRVAIVGTGIAGNAAAFILNRAGIDFTLYEQGDYIGGHSNTVQIDDLSVDTGFIVYNTATYPNFIAMTEYLQVPTMPTDMSFGVSLHQGQVEYAGHALFAQPKNLVSPRFWGMLVDIARFYLTVEKDAARAENKHLSLADYLEAKRYGKGFIDDHLLPMAAAIWSSATDDVRSFPLTSFVQFFANHGLLKFKNRPQWRTVKGGSQAYVKALTHMFRDRIKLNSPVTAVRRTDGGVIVTTSEGEEAFDEIILACHADQSLALLQDATPVEQDVLSCFPYSENTVWLHTDPALMPRDRKVWSSWNYINLPNSEKLCVSYWMNRLQPFIGPKRDIFVTLNPPREPAKEHVLGSYTYHHPQFTMQAKTGWERLSTIQGQNKTWFCGAWCGCGFHEDGMASGLQVAETLSGQRRPWHVTEMSPAARHIQGTK